MWHFGEHGKPAVLSHNWPPSIRSTFNFSLERGVSIRPLQIGSPSQPLANKPVVASMVVASAYIDVGENPRMNLTIL